MENFRQDYLWTDALKPGIFQKNFRSSTLNEFTYTKDESDQANGRSGAICHPQVLENISSWDYTWFLH